MNQNSAGWIHLALWLGLLERPKNCERVWVLESAYDQARADVARALEQIVRTADFDLEHAAHVRTAIERYRSTSADFADVIVGLVNEAAGCEHTLTFDRSLKRIPQFKVI